MLAALTANINRAEKTEPIGHHHFLRYPSADLSLIEGVTAESVSVSLSLVPSKQLAVNMLGMRDKLVATYIWQSDYWLN